MANKLRSIPAKQNKADLTQKLVQRSLEDSKAVDITVINLAGKSDVADYMVVATGTSTRHIGSMAEQVVQRLGESKLTTVISTEGMTQCSWVVVDTPFVVVHLFLPEVRSLYNLEKMWNADFEVGHSLQL